MANGTMSHNGVLKAHSWDTVIRRWTANHDGTVQRPPAERTLQHTTRISTIVSVSALGLVNLANLLRIIQPLLCGLLINDMLQGSPRSVPMLLSLCLVHVLAAALRKAAGEWTVSVVLPAVTAVHRHIDRGVPAVRLDSPAKSTHLRICCELIESTIPRFIAAAWSVLGAIAILGWYDWRMVPLCVCLMVPAVFMNSVGASRSRRNGDPSVGNRHRPTSRRGTNGDHGGDTVDPHSVAPSNESWPNPAIDEPALRFGLFDLMTLGLVTAALIVFSSFPGREPGDVFAAICYILLFVTGMDAIPQLAPELQRMLRTLDRAARIAGRRAV